MEVSENSEKAKNNYFSTRAKLEEIRYWYRFVFLILTNSLLIQIWFTDTDSFVYIDKKLFYQYQLIRLYWYKFVFFRYRLTRLYEKTFALPIQTHSIILMQIFTDRDSHLYIDTNLFYRYRHTHLYWYNLPKAAIIFIYIVCIYVLIFREQPWYSCTVFMNQSSRQHA